MYGIDNKLLISFINGNFRRQDEIDIHLRKYLESPDNGNLYKLKRERQKKSDEWTFKLSLSVRFRYDIEKPWKIKLAKE